MTWQTIRKAGYLYESNNLPAGDGFQQAGEFLQKMSTAFAQACQKYFHVMEELPFIYGERQLASALLPAIGKVAQAAFVEQPILRKNELKEGTGHVDYWVLYGEDEYVFLIELKHGYQGRRSEALRSDTAQSWRDALEQIEAIDPTEAKDVALYKTRLYKIALLIVPVYEGSSDQDKLGPASDSQEEALEIHDRVIGGLSRVANWSCVWALHEDLLKAQLIGEDRYEIYPCVAIVARVVKV